MSLSRCPRSPGRLVQAAERRSRLRILANSRFVSGYGFSHILKALESARLQPLPFLRFGITGPSEARSLVLSAFASNEVLAEKILDRVGFFLGFLAEGGLPCN